MKGNNKGFTLIELLVVIAIIGILSSVVLASLTTARTKGQDASVQSQLSNMRAQAELYYSSQNPNSYGPVLTAAAACPTSGTTMFNSTGTGGLKTLIAGVAGVVTASKVYCIAGKTSDTGNATSWAVAADKPSSPDAKYYCVDSSGVSKEGTGKYDTAIDNSTGLCKP